MLAARRILVASLLAAAVLTGCASTNDYVDTVNNAQSEVLDAARDLGSDPNASKREILASLEDAEAKAKEAVDELNEVEIPDDAEDGHAKLVEGFEDLSALISDVRENVESESGDAFAELRNQGADIDRRIDAAIDQINSDLGLE